jgi:hypothetical protein
MTKSWQNQPKTLQHRMVSVQQRRTRPGDRRNYTNIQITQPPFYASSNLR